MAKQEKLEHELDGKSPFDRLSDAEYAYRRAAENIGRNLGDAPAAGLLKLWMESETHRDSLLWQNAQFQRRSEIDRYWD